MSQSIETFYPSKRWRIKTLLLCQFAFGLILFSFFYEPTHLLWDKLDLIFFKSLNSTLEGNRPWQIFWALANHKNADWLEDLVIIGFFTLYIRSAPSQFRPRRLAEMLFFILYTAAIIYFVNRLFFREYLEIPRPSPSLIVEPCVRLSYEIPWLHIKDMASRSFPGDHATTAILFGASISYFARWKVGLCASLYSVFLCLPRLITGAHWLSDVVIGSGAIVLFFLSWIFCTPIHITCIQFLEKLLSRKPKPTPT